MNDRRPNNIGVICSDLKNPIPLSTRLREYAKEDPLNSFIDDIEYALIENPYIDDVIEHDYMNDTMTFEFEMDGLIGSIQEGIRNGAIDSFETLLSTLKRLFEKTEYYDEVFFDNQLWTDIADYYTDSTEEANKLGMEWANIYKEAPRK